MKIRKAIIIALSIVVVVVAIMSSAVAGGVGTEVNVNAIMARKFLEDQVRQRVTRIQGSLNNSQNNYYAESQVNSEGWADLTINDPAPGAYSSYVFGQEYSEQLGRYITRLEGRSEIVVNKGNNLFTSEMTLIEWQDIVIKLPSAYMGGEQNFNGSFMIGGQKYGANFYLAYPEYDRQYLGGMVSINATSDISLIFNGRKYTIPLETVLRSIGESKAIPLASCTSEDLTTLTIKASVMEDYIIVPTEVATIRAAMEFAQAGQTVLVKFGFYGDNFVHKAGVRLYGDPSYPEGVIIKSDQPWTVKSYGAGKYEIVGVTIRNTYNGEKRWNHAAALFDLGADVRMHHVIIESSGTADGIVTNYAPLQLANITFKGSGTNTALKRYNNNQGESLENLLFHNWDKSAAQSNGPATVKNSLFYQAPMVAGDGSNIIGDPQFLSQYGSGLRPNVNAPAVQQIMSQTGNYPGAVSPQLP